MAIVLLLSLGRSAIYSVLSIIDKLTRGPRLSDQTTTINPAQTPDRPWLDAMYQVANLVLPLMPVALCLYLLATVYRPAEGPFRVMGFDLRRPGRDLLQGFAIFAGIGTLGLAFYLFAVAIGINTQINTSGLQFTAWNVTVLILRAVMNGVLEEVVMIGYLFTRWAQGGGRMWVIVVVSAVIRGGYHLYQGFGGFIGNLVMGLVFGWLFLKVLKGRVMPLVVTHSLLDIFSFLGAPLLPWLMSLIGR
ncbi:CPBP family intramembrane metalloprotease [Tessaracoccus sp. HDW20]|nr:CPBP family intramembrane metalloprotease [Tessaracoccus coleopterorum]